LIKIAHRGNVDGPSEAENQPAYILDAIAQGYDVEVDIWFVGGTLWLGHDYAQYQIDYTFLSKIADKSWFHCKNKEALSYFRDSLSSLNYFWHESDKYTLTSTGYIWVYPGESAPDRGVIVDLDLSNLEAYKHTAYAVCTDYPSKLGD
jgi:hypothetical protein